MRQLFPDNNFVAPYLSDDLRIMVGEAPGASEAEQGVPFVGGSGRWLKVIYAKAGIKFEGVSRCNVINCQSPNNIFPTDSQARSYISDSEAHQSVQQCLKNHVEPLLKSRPWKRIDTFGDKPLKFILGKSGGVTTWRGSILPVESLGPAPIAVPTFHPAYIARDQSMLPVVINDLRKTLTVEPENYEIYPTLDQVRAFHATKFAFDLECNRWNNADISMVGLSASPYCALVVPFTGEYIHELRRIFGAAEEVIGQNCIQFDLPILARQGIKIRGPKECKVWDIMLMHHLRFPVFPHDLEFIGKQFTNKGAWKADKAIFEVYNARDVDVTFRCFKPLKDLLEQAKLLDIYTYVSWPLALICKNMTDAGVTMNGNRLMELRKDYLARIEGLEQQLPEQLKPFFVTKRRRIPAPVGALNKSGKPRKYDHEEYQLKITPWRSSDVKKKYLYETLGLPVQRQLKTKEPTADKGALDKLYNKTKHPALKLLKELSKYATLLSNFAKEEYEGIGTTLHPHFNPHGTSTGRLSSSGPSFQNQAISTRYMYVSRFEDGRLVDADFSGIENRITAYLAKDTDRLGWLKDPSFSEHKFLVAMFFGIPYEEVQKSHDPASPYAICKRIVHGTNYCMGARKIAEQYDLDLTTVKQYQAKWKAMIHKTSDWQRRVMNDAKRLGYVENLFGRKLWLWESGSGPQAVAFHPQSNAAEVLIRVMIGLMYERVGWPLEWTKKVVDVVCPLPEPAVMIASVHDEILCDSPPDLVEKVLSAMTTVMSQPWKPLGNMVLPISIGAEKSWGDFEG
jgi:uracil-DNA glycosylase family 4